MSFIDFFVERKETGQEAVPNNSVAAAPSNPNGGTPSVIPPPSVVQTPPVGSNTAQSSVSDEKDKELLEKLVSFLDGKDLPGPDYMELKKVANNPAMVQSVSDESQRFSLSYVSLKAMNPHLTKSIILNSIDTYVDIMLNEEKVAMSELDEKRKVEVDDKKALIENMTAQMTELQQKLSDLTAQRQTMQAEVDAAERECAEDQNRFKRNVNLIVTKLKDDRGKLEKCLTD